MNWTCEQTETRLSDYLDGLLGPAEQAAFDLHVNSCERCTLLVAGVSHVLSTLHTLAQVEPRPQLFDSILTATLGPQSWRRAKRWLRGLRSPRFVYSAVSVAATFVVILTASGFSFRKPKLADLNPAMIYRKTNSQAHRVYAQSAKFVSDLRVVYEIQTRLLPGSKPFRRVLPANNLAAPTTRIRPRQSSRTVPTKSAGICGFWLRNSPFWAARLVRGELHEVCRPF